MTNNQLDLFSAAPMATSLVRVYRNLTNGKISILDKATGLVIGHADGVHLVPHEDATEVRCIVNQAGRNRVLKERKKYVHAYIEGAIASMLNWTPYKGRTYAGTKPPQWKAGANIIDMTYNPYKMATFCDKANGRPIQSLLSACVDSSGSITGELAA